MTKGTFETTAMSGVTRSKAAAKATHGRLGKVYAGRGLAPITMSPGSPSMLTRCLN